MGSRRKFLRHLSIGVGSTFLSNYRWRSVLPERYKSEGPVVLSTWQHGLAANEMAWGILKEGGYALDAVEEGVAIIEADLTNRSVGLGGLPDREGIVTLDASIMDEGNNCGAVAFLQDIQHPVKVARLVMTNSPHVMIVGRGAYEFAIANGFKPVDYNVPVPKSKKAWEKWREQAEYRPIINMENHDTIGMLAMDKDGRICGSCTTSGLAYKMHGRVGDSPIIGAGLFVDGAVGGAVATGLGEAIIRVAGAHTVVELMRQGAEPTEACREVVLRIKRKHTSVDNMQVGFLALRRDGEYGSYAMHPGFNYAMHDGRNRLLDSEYAK